jgi:hypothetical protein
VPHHLSDKTEEPGKVVDSVDIAKSAAGMEEKRSEKHEQARNSLPEELRSVFHDFVADYKFAATKHHGAPFVSYIVLAEMVRAGWRLTADNKHPLNSEPQRRDPSSF